MKDKTPGIAREVGHGEWALVIWELYKDYAY